MMSNYDINYEDERFKEVEADKEQAMNEVDETYGNMIGQAEEYYNEQIEASREWGEKQQEIQQENTDFAIEQIEQAKEQAEKSYLKEQSGAYADWQKESNKYGANAEQMAQSGLTGSGFSESSQVQMYNAYQSRVAMAREGYNQAVLNYDNAIKEAQLQNNAQLAEIAYQTLQQQLELSLQGFQYQNQLLMEQMNHRQQVDDRYYNRYQDVLNQMNTENAMAEQIRQYEEQMAFQKEQFAEEKRQFNESMAASRRSSSGGSYGRSSGGSYQIQQNSQIDKTKTQQPSGNVSASKSGLSDAYINQVASTVTHLPNKAAKEVYIADLYNRGLITEANLNYFYDRFGLGM